MYKNIFTSPLLLLKYIFIHFNELSLQHLINNAWNVNRISFHQNFSIIFIVIKPDQHSHENTSGDDDDDDKLKVRL